MTRRSFGTSARFGFTVSLPNRAPCPEPFRFSDQLLFSADFSNWLFLLISPSPGKSLQDAGQLLPATRPEAESFSLTEEDFPPPPSPLRHAPVLQ